MSNMDLIRKLVKLRQGYKSILKEFSETTAEKVKTILEAEIASYIADIELLFIQMVYRLSQQIGRVLFTQEESGILVLYSIAQSLDG